MRKTERMRECLEAIRDWDADEHPEVLYDEWAYRRMVNSFRRAAHFALTGERKDFIETDDPAEPEAVTA